MNRFAAGIDLGTAYTKALVIDFEGRILACSMEKTGFRPDRVAQRCLETVLASAGLEGASLCAVVSTGFARHLCSARTMALTELTAAAHGARFLFPAARMVLDVGGQTIKACRFDAACRITAFRLNDKCASGTGAFLERTAGIMNQHLDGVDELVQGSTAPAPISSVCAVFAESEIISQLVLAVAPRDIMHGAIKACVDRAAQIALRVGLEHEICLVGGVAKFEKASAMLRERFAGALQVPAAGAVQFVAALGAARIGIRFGKK